jgi:hypothetical protein
MCTMRDRQAKRDQGGVKLDTVMEGVVQQQTARLTRENTAREGSQGGLNETKTVQRLLGTSWG